MNMAEALSYEKEQNENSGCAFASVFSHSLRDKTGCKRRCRNQYRTISFGKCRGEIQPLIIVLPTYNNTSRSDSGDYSLALQITAMGNVADGTFLANGFLSAQYGKDSVFDGIYDYRSMMPQFTAEGVDKNQELISLLQAIAAEKQATPAQISLAWMLCKSLTSFPFRGQESGPV